MAELKDDNKSKENTEVKPPEPVVFTPEQQKFLDEVLVPKVMGKAGSEHKKAAEELAQKNQELVTKMTDLETKLTALETSSSNTGTNKDDKEKILNELEEVKRVNKNLQLEREEFKKKVDEHKKTVDDTNARMLELRKRTAMQQAASKCNFRDLKVVELLTSEYIKWDADSNAFVVVNDKGATRMNSMMDPISLEEYYREYAASTPYLVNGDVTPGAGSTEATRGGKTKYKLEEVFGPKSDARKAIALKRENPDVYKSMKQTAIEQGLLGTTR